MKINSRLLLLLFSVLGGATYCVAEEPATPPVDLAPIVKRLTSEEFKEREAAQRELDKVSYRQLAALEELARTATDPESKSRLQKRVEALREGLATDPPPISLELTSEPFAKTIEALGKATGTAMTSWPPHVDPNDGRKFTISAKEAPFWEVFSQLSQQHGLEFMEAGQGLQIHQTNPGWSHGAITGPFAVFPIGINKSKNVALQNAPETQAQPEQLTLSIHLAADPRLVILKYASTEFTEIKDDFDNDLLSQRNEGFWRPVSFGATSWMESTNLNLPNHPGKMIRSAKGIVHCIVGTAFERLEVTEPEKKLGQPLTVAGRTIVIRNLSAMNNQISLQSELQEGIVRKLFGGAGDDVSSVTLTLIDVNNQRIHSYSVQGSMSASFGGAFAAPLKIELTVTTKVKELALPFELKDLLLP